MTDDIQARFGRFKRRYAEGDPDALREFEARIATAGRNRSLITYSELVDGMPLNLSNLKESPRHIDVSDWQELDRTIVGESLGYAAMRSYELGKFFSSSLVVSKHDGSPGDGFYNLLKDLGLIPNRQSTRALDLWADHVAKAHTWYSSHR
ncbi:MAG: hypothetical protein LC723_04135 [Actinobacteria bacterium]|nr:hypothetical protein [Actinomycetota bacterium]